MKARGSGPSAGGGCWAPWSCWAGAQLLWPLQAPSQDQFGFQEQSGLQQSAVTTLHTIQRWCLTLGYRNHRIMERLGWEGAVEFTESGNGLGWQES